MLGNLLKECPRYNKYAQITARALRASLKEEERVVAEKRGVTNARYQKWENGVGQQQVCFNIIHYPIRTLTQPRSNLGSCCRGT